MKRAPLLNSNKIQKCSNFQQCCAEVSGYLPLLQNVAAMKQWENNWFTLNGWFRQLLHILPLWSCTQRHFINGGALVKTNDAVELIELLAASLRIQFFPKCIWPVLPWSLVYSLYVFMQTVSDSLGGPQSEVQLETTSELINRWCTQRPLGHQSQDLDVVTLPPFTLNAAPSPSSPVG